MKPKPKLKRCSDCKEEKPISDFAKNRRARDGLFAYCKPCARRRSLAWKAANPERAKAYTAEWKRNNRERLNEYQRNWYAENSGRWPGYAASYRERHPEAWARKQRSARLVREYGVTLEEYEVMVAKQGGVCWICRQPPDGRGKYPVLCLDHDHTTGQLRGLLCHQCNRGIGFWRDDADMMARAVKYLRRKVPGYLNPR